MIECRFKINEELSVSADVVQLTNIVSKFIQNKLKTSQRGYSKHKNVIVYKGLSNINTEGLLKTIDYLKVKYTVYFFKNQDDLRYYLLYASEPDGTMYSYADYEKKMINLVLYYIKEQPSPDFDSIIQHELNHIYQYDNGQTKNEDFYNKIVDLQKNGNEVEKKIALALYYIFNTEIASFASQYYAYLKQNNIPKTTKGKDYYSLDVNNPYYRLNKVFEDVYDLEDEINETDLINKLGITKEKLWNILNNGEKKFYRKMANAWTKYMTESSKKGKYIQHIFIDPRMEFLWECRDKGITEEFDELDDLFLND